MNKYPKVNIIIPLYVISDRFFQDLLKFKNLDYPNFEILIVCDQKVTLPQFKKIKVRLILTGQSNTGPAEKRDIALKYAKGVFCAFIDDDAYPDPDWLKNAVNWFKNPDIIAVGGPGVTPPNDGYWEKISGCIIESYFCSGGIQHRFYVNKNTLPTFVDDWPAYNFLIRTKSLKKVGGFDSNFYGGEDTYVCLKLNKMGKMVFEPQAVVYHHRRAFPLAHLKQIRNVGIHRGYFFKAYPKTSRRLLYLLPTILTLGLITGMFLVILQPNLLLLPFLAIFLIAVSVGTLSVYFHGVSLGLSLISGFGIILTHVCYGSYFLIGLAKKNLNS